VSARKQKAADLATITVHAGNEGRDVDSAVVNPLVQSVNFIQEVGTGEGLRYPRYGNAPNAELVQRRIAALEGAEAAVLLGSGMGATACALLALLRPGDHLISSSRIYGGAHALLSKEFVGLGIHVTFVDPTESRTWRKKLRKETRAIFLETPMNPSCRVIDMRPVSYVTKEVGIALVVDSTFASPINLRPLEHGADVVIHSATKYLNGHHDVLGGIVCGTASYIEEVRQKMMLWGQAPDPFAAWLLERGLSSLAYNPARVVYLFHLGQAYEQLGERALAAETYDHATKAFPGTRLASEAKSRLLFDARCQCGQTVATSRFLSLNIVEAAPLR